MGIKQLSKLIADNAAEAIREQQIKSYFGRKVAIDASMTLYQFLIAVRSDSMAGQMTNEHGEVTSHLIGLFYRTIRMLKNGIKPVYVFDGKPPSMKSGELEKRRAARQKAREALVDAKKADNPEEVKKQERRLVRVGSKETDGAKKLLRLMGIPVVEAPCEAEATCAELCKKGLVYATATEDMDALTFGTPKLLRHLTYSEARKVPVHEFDLKVALDRLDLTMEQFIDVCILSGCDYTGTIRKIGPKTALKHIKEYGTIEKMLANIDQKKYIPDEDFRFVEARRMFLEPEVIDVSTVKLKWNQPDEEGLIKFMVDENGFNLDRVKNGVAKIREHRKKGGQKRLESFFGAATIKYGKRKNTNKGKGRPKKKQKTGYTLPKKTRR